MKLHATCKRTKNSLSYGFTYVEVLVALSIVGVIIGIHAVLGSDVIARNEVRNERDTFVSNLLMIARTRALTNQHESTHGVHIDTITNTYVLFRGNTFDDTNPDNESIPFQNKDITIVSTEGNDTIIFEALTGQVLQGAGSYTFSLPNQSLTVEVNDVGRIDW